MEKNSENNNSIKAPALITIAKYKRVSTDNQELTLQNEILDKHIKRLKEDNPSKKYNVLDFEDFAQSGKNTERKQFQKMIELVEKNNIDLVIFTKLDRLGRSLQDLLNIILQLLLINY